MSGIKNYRVGFCLALRKAKIKPISVLKKKISEVNIGRKIILQWALK